jgi:hypothetical protein
MLGRIHPDYGNPWERQDHESLKASLGLREELVWGRSVRAFSPRKALLAAPEDLG